MKFKLILFLLLVMMDMTVHSQSLDWYFLHGSFRSTPSSICVNGDNETYATYIYDGGSFCLPTPCELPSVFEDFFETAYLHFDSMGTLLNWRLISQPVSFSGERKLIPSQDGIYSIFETSPFEGEILKLNSSLEDQWTHNINYQPKAAQSDEGGNIYLGGTRGTPMDSLVIEKRSPQGQIIWSTKAAGKARNLTDFEFSNNNTLTLYCWVVDSLNFTEYNVSTATETGTPVVIELDLDTGVPIAIHTLSQNSSGIDGISYAFQQTPQGEYILLGYAEDSLNLGETFIYPPIEISQISNNGFYYLAVFNENFSFSEIHFLDPRFSKPRLEINGTGEIYLSSRSLEVNSCLYLPNDYCLTLSNPEQGGFLVKLNNSFDYLWSKNFKSEGLFSPDLIHEWDPDHLQDIAIKSNGQVVVFGRFQGCNPSAALGIELTGDLDFSSIYLVEISGNDNLIQGNAWIDLNNNSIQDNSDPDWEYAPILLNNGLTSYTNSNGRIIIPAHPDSNRLSLGMIPDNYSVFPQEREINFINDEDQIATGQDFRLVPDFEFSDLCVSIIERTPVRPGFQVEWWLECSNFGSIPASGTVQFQLPEEITFISASPTPSSVMGETISWSIELGPFETIRIGITGTVDAMAILGDMVRVGAAINGENDTNLLNNQDAIIQTITGSFDPNDKTSYPSGAVDIDDYNPNRPLEYLIRFQNTGTDTAFNVFIIDTLPSILDPCNLDVIAASHPFNLDYNGDNIVQFNFDDILLPDSTTNLEASNGFVKFSIQTRETLELGDSVENRAAIYFDFNAPIITNFAQLKIVNLPSSTNTFTIAKQIRVYPNPTRDQLHIQPESAILIHSLHIFNSVGQEVLQYQNNNDEIIDLNISTLETGVYFMLLESTNQEKYSVRFVKS